MALPRPPYRRRTRTKRFFRMKTLILLSILSVGVVLSTLCMMLVSYKLRSNAQTETRKLSTLSSQEITDTRHDSILVVGGSDGSGTRVVVDALMRLGVPMLVDDPVTLDVHATVMFQGEGWPGLVRNMFNLTHSANYDLSDLPPGHHLDSLKREVTKFRQSYNARAGRLLHQATHSKQPLPSRVSYGFKAPCTMLLLPFLHNEYKHIKFIHVVRDGRDVALSDNTSPVDKFYDVFFEHAAEKRNQLSGLSRGDATKVLAMQLWTAWNTQVLAWTRRNKQVETMVVRTEDLLNPNRRYLVLQQMASFVGSAVSSRDICRMSLQPVEDLGRSTSKGGESYNTHYETSKTRRRTMLHRGKGLHFGSLQHEAFGEGISERPERSDTHDASKREMSGSVDSKRGETSLEEIKHRYGKWKRQEQTNPDLVSRLTETGLVGLDAFGYNSLTVSPFGLEQTGSACT